MGESILTKHVITAQTPPSTDLPKPTWDVNKFESLIHNNGYHAYIERALRCPCCDRATGQALSTCRNCNGKGWIFVDKRETRVVAQSMANLRKNTDIGEVNRGTARITTRAIDKLGFMDRVMLLDLEAYHTEVIRPTLFRNRLLAYPVYEPMEVTNMYLFVGDAIKLEPLPESLYKINGNEIEFDQSIMDMIPVEDMNQKQPDISISIRYSYHPVYHIVDVNRELMKVREGKCTFSDDTLRSMPISAVARKAHYIFDNNKYGNETYDNSIVE